MTLSAAVQARLPRHDDDRGSIPLLLLVMIVTVALGGLVMSSIITQTRTVKFNQTRVHSLDAAQAGLDYVLGQIRMAVGTNPGSGDDAKLPCGPWANQPADSNTTAGASSTSTFSAGVMYFTSNPTTMTDTVRASSKMICAAGAGPYDPTAKLRTPRYAVITSTGIDKSVSGSNASKGRTVETTYVFQTNDVNISGGQIRVFPSGSTNYCMDAGQNPAAGTAVTLQQCSTSNPPVSSQIWSYRSDLSIELVSSSAPPSPGLCLDTADPTTHAAGRAIVLKQCAVADQTPSQPAATFVCPSGYTPASYQAAYPAQNCAVSPYDQQWSVDDSAHLRGATTDQTNTDSYCIDAATQANNTALLMQSCAGSVTDTRQTWVPAPTTGAGMAGAGVQQLVNYAQFATCIDVTGQDVNASYLIAYTCKQNPDPTKVAWNQKFTPSPKLSQGPTTVLLTTTTGGVTYCLKSPLAVGGYPVLSNTCPSSPTGAYAWTVSQHYASNASTSSELAYANRYTIKDSYAGAQGNLCLGLGSNSDLLNGAYYKIVVSGCNGSTAQKWNADPSKLKASLTNTREVETTAGN